MRTIRPRVTTFWKVVSTATVRMISAATRNSSPSKMVLPRFLRSPLKAAAYPGRLCKISPVLDQRKNGPDHQHAHAHPFKTCDSSMTAGDSWL